jgi:hypothetical protein
MYSTSHGEKENKEVAKVNLQQTTLAVTNFRNYTNPF